METRFEWQYKSANPLAAAEYKDFNVSELLAQVLVNRGVSAREYSKISYHFNDLRTEYLESIVDLERGRAAKNAARDDSTLRGYGTFTT